MTGELRRYLKREINLAVRARLEAAAARERVCVCGECGELFTSPSPDARTCTDACRQRAYRRRLREAVAA